MVETQLRPRGIRSERVLEAMATVPRHRFVPGYLEAEAYDDRALPLASGQTISQPFIVAAMTDALEPGPDDTVLEVGTGSGYQAAVLGELVDEVWTIERIGSLAEEARERLRDSGADNVHVVLGDGSRGLPEEAPFDGILVAAAAPEVPEALKEQLSPDGGRLVIPVGSRAAQELVRVVREGTSYRTERLLGCRFVPLVGEEGWAPE